MSTSKNRQAAAVADSRLTVLVNSEAGALAVSTALPGQHEASRINVVQRCTHRTAQAENLLVFSAASNLDHVAECVSVANKAHRLVALLVQSDVDSNWLPYVFHRTGLRALRNMIVHSDCELPTRILNAWAIGGEHDFIADAAVLNNELVVRTCALDEYSISFDEYPALRRIPRSERSDFVLEEDGLLLAWPQWQVHLDVEDIRFANDPMRRQTARVRRIADQRAIGAALRRIRQKAGLKQSEIKGISERQVRRIEAGDRLGTDALDAFAAAMRLDADVLLDVLSEMIDEPEASALTAASRDTSKPEPDSATVRADARDVLTYPRPKPPKPSRGNTSFVSEGLRLAADTSANASRHNWDVDVASHGVIRGRIEHDYETDELFFVVDDLSDAELESLRVSIVLWAKRISEPVTTVAFAPMRGGKISLSRNRAILPSDVIRIDARIEHEQ